MEVHVMEILKETISVCPECMEHVHAQIVADESSDEVYMKKKCDIHGEFIDRLATKISEYKWQMNFTDAIGSTVNNETTPEKLLSDTKKGCPFDCGLCKNHKTAPNIALIDLTNRCNLACPVCFANAGATGYLVEPNYEEVVQILEHFRSIRPNPPPLLQLSGGEPTLHPDLLKIVKVAKEMGFIEVMLTTNGIRMAKSVQYCIDLIDAGVDAIYLSFGGVEAETTKKLYGIALNKSKMQSIKNFHEALKSRPKSKSAIILVPTIIKGINDHEIGNIFNVAKEYIGTISGITFQPVSLCGRISQEDVLKMRYTTSDLKKEINRVTNNTVSRFYPIATASKFIRLVNWFDDKDEWCPNSHSDCGFATIIILDQNNNWISIDDYVDVEGMIKYANDFYDRIKQMKPIKPFTMLNVEKPNNSLLSTVMENSDKLSDLTFRSAQRVIFLAGAMKYLKPNLTNMLNNKDLRKFIFDFINLFMEPSLKSASHFMKDRHLLLSSMHFQDAYNFDINRVSRCLVHYGVIDPDDPKKVLEIPFCAMNTIHRERIEREIAEKKRQLISKEALKQEASNSINEIVQLESVLP